MKIEFTIELPPVTKKNSQRIIKVSGRPISLPSKKYEEYEEMCYPYMPKGEPIDYPVNVGAVFYMPTRRIVDIGNLISALHDVLVKYQVVKDDNSKIIAGVDGCRVMVDRERPRTEVTITPICDGGEGMPMRVE